MICWIGYIIILLVKIAIKVEAWTLLRQAVFNLAFLPAQFPIPQDG